MRAEIDLIFIIVTKQLKRRKMKHRKNRAIATVNLMSDSADGENMFACCIEDNDGANVGSYLD